MTNSVDSAFCVWARLQLRRPCLPGGIPVGLGLASSE